MPPFIWPLKKSSQRITQSFGDIWSADSSKKHTGIDIAATPGDSVTAAAFGIITRTGSLDATGKWAKYAVLEHISKDYCTSYLHIDPQVSVGQKFNAGDIVGVVANIVSPHFHFNIWKGPKDEKITQRGALPIVYKPGGDPAFPSNFLDPKTFSYSYINDIKTSPSTVTNTILFTRDLSKDCSCPDVKLLQKLLNTDPDTRIALTGVGSPGQETDHFGDLTEKAVQKFQDKYNIASSGNQGYGLVGPRTRDKLQKLFGNNIYNF